MWDPKSLCKPVEFGVDLEAMLLELGGMLLAYAGRVLPALQCLNYFAPTF